MRIELLEEPSFLYYEQLLGRVYKIPMRYTISLEAIPFEKLRYLDGPRYGPDCEINFEFQGIHYDTLRKLLAYINRKNEDMSKYYLDKFKIRPAYSMVQTLDQDGVVQTLIGTHNETYRFYSDEPIDEDIIEKRVPVFSYANIREDDRFCVDFLIMMHNSIMKNQIVMPCTYEDTFVVRLGKTVVSADIRNDEGGKFNYYLCFTRHPCDCIFTFYDIKYDEFSNLRTNPHYDPYEEVPMDSKYSIARIIDYINANYCACEGSEFEVRGKTINCDRRQLEIVQTPAGKWYIKGAVLEAFNLRSMEAVRKIASELFGKRVVGVFPECDSREDLMKLVEVLRKSR